MNFLKFLLSNETVLTKTCDIFSLASQVRLQLNLLLFPFRDDEFDGGICYVLTQTRVEITRNSLNPKERLASNFSLQYQLKKLLIVKQRNY